jgi:hypothetical protein
MSVALTYFLTDQCGGARPFCRLCTNSFSVTTCASVCTAGPSVICLKPTITAEICPACATSRLVLVSGFDPPLPAVYGTGPLRDVGFFDAWVGDWLLTNTPEEPCGWNVTLPEFKTAPYETSHLSRCCDEGGHSVVCTETITVQEVTTGEMHFGWSLGNLQFQWVFRTHLIVVTGAAGTPPCAYSTGDDLGIIEIYSSPLIPQASTDCDNTPMTFNIRTPPSTASYVTVEFLDGSDL